MRQNDKIFANVDWQLFIAFMIMLFLGLATVYSVAYNPEQPNLFSFSEKYGKQSVWVGVSLFIGLIIFLINSEVYRKYAEVIYAITIIMLIIVLFMPPIHGARAWIGIGSMGIQPAEFAKIATALLLAKYVDSINIKLQNTITVFQTIGIILIPALLVALQPDAGTLLVFSSFLFVLYSEGISFDPIVLKLLAVFPRLRFKSTWLGSHFIPLMFYFFFLCVISLYLSGKQYGYFNNSIHLSGNLIIYIVLGILLLLTLLFVNYFGIKRERKKLSLVLLVGFGTSMLISSMVSFAFKNLAAPHQKDRIEVVLGLKDDPNGIDYNRNRAMAAVGSGGFFGKGYREASVSSLTTNHVPESETDFIFCPFAEEWGFFGSLVLIGLYLFILYRIFRIAERQRSVFYRVYANCVGMILFYHFAINIGMNIGFVPVIGIPLPYFSYGGSSMMAFSVMMFLLIKLDSQRKDVLR